MPKLNFSTIGIIVVLVAVVGGVYLFSVGGPSESGQEQQERESEKRSQQESQERQFIPEVERLSAGGRVTSINIAENSFVLFMTAEDRSFTVRLGENTVFERLTFSFDINDPPAGASFTPIAIEVTIADLKIGEQVFVRSFVPIEQGDEVVDPQFVQILPSPE